VAARLTEAEHDAEAVLGERRDLRVGTRCSHQAYAGISRYKRSERWVNICVMG
jgi:hypothetical protein